MERVNYTISRNNSSYLPLQKKQQYTTAPAQSTAPYSRSSGFVALSALSNYNRHLVTEKSTAGAVSFGYNFFIKELPGLHCAYTGIPVLSTNELNKLNDKVLSSSGSVIKGMLVKYKKDLELSKFVPGNKNIEKKVLEDIIRAADAHPNTKGEKLIQKLVAQYEVPLNNHMLGLLDSMKTTSKEILSAESYNKLCKVLAPTERKLDLKEDSIVYSLVELYHNQAHTKRHNKKLVQLIEYAGRQPRDFDTISRMTGTLDASLQDKVNNIILAEKTCSMLKRKNILNNLNVFRDSLTNPEEFKNFSKVLNIASQIPQSVNTPEAFIVKYGHRSSRDVLEMVFNPIKASAEHIHPHSDEGLDGPSNYLNTAKFINEYRMSIPFEKFLEDNEKCIPHINNSINEIYGLTKLSRVDNNDKNQIVNYITQVTRTLETESGGKVKITIDDPDMPEKYKQKLGQLLIA